MGMICVCDWDLHWDRWIADCCLVSYVAQDPSVLNGYGDGNGDRKSL